MKLTEERSRFIIYAILTLAVFFFLKTYCLYDYLYAEQLRLFRYSDTYAIPLLTTCGGPATYLADYLTQFYISPTYAALINAGFFLAIALLVDAFCSKALSHWLSPVLAVYVAIYMIVQETNLEHNMEDTLALILTLTCLNGILLMKNRILAGCACLCTMALLYYFNGSFLLLLILLVIACISLVIKNKVQIKDFMPANKTLRTAWPVVAVVAALWLGMQTYTMEHHPQSTRLKCLETMRWNKDWDGILSLPYMQVCPAPLYAAYQNLALAEKGILGEELEKHTQMGTLGLWYENHGLQNELMLLSDIYYIQGNVAASQMMAFNGLAYATRVAHPHLLLRLVETNLILGAYPVAEKYISILEETRFYKEKATSYRKFLNHPEVINQDPRLGTLRKIAFSQKGISSDMLTDLQKIVESNPDYKPAVDYLNSYVKLTVNEKEQ